MAISPTPRKGSTLGLRGAILAPQLLPSMQFLCLVMCIAQIQRRMISLWEVWRRVKWEEVAVVK